jgi:hypothetical protein
MKRPNLKELDVKIRNVDVLNLHHALSNIKGMKGTALVYAVGRTLDKLEPIKTKMSASECIPESEEHKEYIKAIHEIHKKFSGDKMKVSTDGNGNPIEVYDFPWLGSKEHADKEKKWKKELEELREKYKDAIAERGQDIEDYNSYLEEPFEEDINNYIHKIKEEKLLDCTVPEEMRSVIGYIVE